MNKESASAVIYGEIVEPWLPAVSGARMKGKRANKALHQTAIPLCFIVAGVLGR